MKTTTRWIPRIVVDSSAIASLGYSAETSTLEVEFRSGAIYRYEAVPAEAYRSLLEAESKGAHLNRFIKGRFRYDRI
jgi:hypothetical protein